MTIPAFDVRSEYVGNGSLAEYSFDFRITSLDELKIRVTDSLFVLQYEIDGNDTTYLSDVDFSVRNGGGTITFKSNLTSGYLLTILYADDDPIQETVFKDNSDFTLSRFEAALDVLGGQIQRIAYMAQRAWKIGDDLVDSLAAQFDTRIPIVSTNTAVQDNRNKVVCIGTDNKSLALGPSVVDLAAEASAAAASAAAAATSESNSAASAVSASSSAASATVSAAAAAASAAIAAAIATETQQTIVNNQAAYANITGALFNGLAFVYIRIAYTIYRTDGAIERRETGFFDMEYEAIAAAWRIGARVSSTDALNIADGLAVTTGGQLQYKSDNFAGQTIGKMRWKIATSIGVET